MVVSTPANNEIDPMPMDDSVEFVKIDELEPDKKPTSVLSTMVGNTMALFRFA